MSITSKHSPSEARLCSRRDRRYHDSPLDLKTAQNLTAKSARPISGPSYTPAL